MVFVLVQKRSDGILPREKGKALPNITMVKGRSILQYKKPQFRLRFPQLAPQSGDLFDTCYTLFSYQHSFVVYQNFHISKLVLRVYHHCIFVSSPQNYSCQTSNGIQGSHFIWRSSLLYSSTFQVRFTWCFRLRRFLNPGSINLFI